MSKMTRRVRVEITVDQTEPGSYSNERLGTTSLVIPVAQSDQVGKIVQAHLNTILTTVEATHGQLPADVEPVEASTEVLA